MIEKLLDKLICLQRGHDWHDERFSYSNNPGVPVNRRCCIRCGKVDCTHELGPERDASEPKVGYVWTEWRVADCVKCKRTIPVYCVTHCEPSNEAMEVMCQAWKMSGKNPKSFGSGFHCELPVQVAGIIDRSGRQAGLDYALSTILGGRVYASLPVLGS